MYLFCHCRTWSGPAWSPAQSLSSVLISIQSLLNEKPYHNEPGFEQVSWHGVLWCTYSYYPESKWKVNENSEFNFTHIFIISAGNERQLIRKTRYGGPLGKGPWGAFIFRPKVRLADLKHQDSLFLLEVPPPPLLHHTFSFCVLHFDTRNSFPQNGQGSRWTEMFKKMLRVSPLLYYRHFLLAGTSYPLLGVKQEEHFVWHSTWKHLNGSRTCKLSWKLLDYFPQLICLLFLGASGWGLQAI